MQSYDENDRIMRTRMMENLNDLKQELDDPKVKHVTVGKIPCKGDEVRVNGLCYRVLKRDKKSRQVLLELMSP